MVNFFHDLLALVSSPIGLCVFAFLVCMIYFAVEAFMKPQR